MERTHPADDFFFDHLGTPVAVSDLSGQVVWTHRFSPFGKTIELNEDADGDGVKLTLNLRFPGQYYDAESGLHYNWHRYYDPETGRYISSDRLFILPTALPAHIVNMLIPQYHYTGNNPLTRWDQFGLYYADYNITFYGFTFGVMLSDDEAYPYLGFAIPTNPTGSLTLSPNDPTLGWNWGFQCMLGTPPTPEEPLPFGGGVQWDGQQTVEALILKGARVLQGPQ